MYDSFQCHQFLSEKDNIARQWEAHANSNSGVAQQVQDLKAVRTGAKPLQFHFATTHFFPEGGSEDMKFLRAKLAATFLGFVKLASIMLWLK